MLQTNLSQDARGQFPQLARLAAACRADNPEFNFFSCLAEAVKDCSLLHKKALRTDNDLSQLDAKAFEALATKVTPHTVTKDCLHCWQQLISVINEVKGYLLLQECGYQQVTFLPETNRTRSPDLLATRDDDAIVLEVKCIFRSNRSLSDARCYPHCDSVQPEPASEVETFLSTAFKEKLRGTIASADDQLNAYVIKPDAKKALLLVTGFDFDPITPQTYNDDFERFCKSTSRWECHFAKSY